MAVGGTRGICSAAWGLEVSVFQSTDARDAPSHLHVRVDSRLPSRMDHLKQYHLWNLVLTYAQPPHHYWQLLPGRRGQIDSLAQMLLLFQMKWPYHVYQSVLSQTRSVAFPHLGIANGARGLCPAPVHELRFEGGGDVGRLHGTSDI